MPLHLRTESADVLVMEAHEAFAEQPAPHERDDEALVDGDHPDPVVLSEPSFDASGRLVWGSMPISGLLGPSG
jgi:hypothetical protein